MKTDRFGRLREKSNDHFTISLPVRFFVNHRKNYNFAILSESNHKPTHVSIKWTFWAYLEFTSFAYIVIITIFHPHGLNVILTVSWQWCWKNRTFNILFEGLILCNLPTWSNIRKLWIYDLRPLEGTEKNFDTIFRISRVEWGG